MSPRTRERLLQLITSGGLAAGEPIRQDEIARALGVSRVPLRDALNSLVAEGVVLHTPNVGYTVARRNVNELLQIYTMRQALETTLLRSVDRFPKDAIDSMTEANLAMSALGADDPATFSRLNHDFHFVMLKASRQDFIVDEIDRLWNMTAAYRVRYSRSADVRSTIIKEHNRILNAIRRNEGDRLIELVNAHRSSALSRQITLTDEAIERQQP